MTGPINLTPKLLEAAGRKATWSPGQLAAPTGTVAAGLPGVEVDWDPSAGEDWARIICGEQVRGILHARIPLAPLVEGPCFHTLAKLTQGAGMVVVPGPDYLESEPFFIDPEVLASLRPSFDWLSDSEPVNLSMHDIYFASV